MNFNHRSALKLLDYEECGESGNKIWPGFEECATGSQLEAVPEQARDKMLEEERVNNLLESFEAGRTRGHEEGRKAEREILANAHEADEKRRKDQMAGTLRQFSEERDRYFHSVEHEVVALALAVAARILRRESQLDPLLLTGAVRVALGQLSGSTEVRLRVPSAELDLWQEAIAHLPNLKVQPIVEPGEGMLTGDCAIHTSAGTVDLGIRAQLSEIERGFFDQVGQRPSVYPSVFPKESEALR